MKSQLVSLCIGSLCFVGSCSLNAQESWQSQLVIQDESGSLTYKKDNDGFVIPDFSQAGYGNGKDLPVVSLPERTITLSPLEDKEADNTQHIQKAIDEVGKQALDAEGIRGVVLLKAGRYNVDGTLNLTYDGVILRGEGNCFSDNDSTVLYGRNAAEKAKRLILMGNSSAHNWGNGKGDAQVNIVTQKVMPGDYSFQVEDASAYRVGDLICIKYPTTTAWLEAVWYGGNTKRNTDESKKWKTKDIDMSYHRYVTKVEGNMIEVDAPVFYALDKQYAQAYIYKISNPGTIRHNVGIENLHISFERSPENSTANVDQNCIYMSSLENSWVKGVSMSGFVHAGIKTTSTTRSTIEDCYAIDPSGLCTGGTYYNFENYHRSQLILLKDCYARNGRHHYISNGCASTSGIVVLNFRSELSLAQAEGHRLWSQGILFDNWAELGTIKSNAGKIGMYLRDNMGSGHGWGGTNSVFWNCDVQDGAIYLDKVPTGQNYAIGCTAKTIRKYRNNMSEYTNGYIEGQNRKGLQPASLYEAQRAARGISTGIMPEAGREDIPHIVVETNRVRVKSQKDAWVSIYTTHGSMVQMLKSSSGNWVESMPLNDDFYVVRVQEAGQKAYSRKVLIRTVGK
ncbi:hypothetical protein K6V21_24130 [Bacteroides cellulosilyticus]|uniref:hypothetical protein n=1 Tax=Bacteroides cellulosilyticus TaxID=246787 RepID=UPI001CCD1F05|nr:hypothetical protein [Bacteroides cellulosilyticus]UBD69418.1 hypothetical protein K6V21_24130 [Bacteroides cellulosilyticus]